MVNRNLVIKILIIFLIISLLEGRHLFGEHLAITTSSFSIIGQPPRHAYWSGLPFPPPGDLLDPEIKPLGFPALAGRFFTSSATQEAHMTNIALQLVSLGQHGQRMQSCEILKLKGFYRLSSSVFLKFPVVKDISVSVCVCV